METRTTAAEVVMREDTHHGGVVMLGHTHHGGPAPARVFTRRKRAAVVVVRGDTHHGDDRKAMRR